MSGRDAGAAAAADFEMAVLLEKQRDFTIYCQNKLNQAKVMKPVWTVLEQLPCIIPPSNFHCCLGHGKMSYGGACSHVKSNEHEGRLSVRHHFLADGIRKLVSR